MCRVGKALVGGGVWSDSTQVPLLETGRYLPFKRGGSEGPVIRGARGATAEDGSLISGTERSRNRNKNRKLGLCWI